MANINLDPTTGQIELTPEEITEISTQVPAGQDGLPGADGAPGSDGAPGPQGIQGPPGNGCAGDIDNYVDIQTALDDNAYKNAVTFHAKTYITGRINVPSGSVIILPPGCVIKDDGKLAENGGFLHVWGVKDVVIVGWGAKIVMDRADYTTGSHRHGVDIRGSKDIYIAGLTSNDSGGDGFYIGTASNKPCEDVHLNLVSADNNRRQGCSIVSGKRITLTHPRLTNTIGASPSAGLDIEPNLDTDFIEDVVIDHPYTENNAGSGIQISIRAITSKAVSIHIIRPTDKGSLVGIGFGRAAAGIGSIIIDSPVSINAVQAGFRARNYYGPKVVVNNPTVISPNRSGNGSPKYAASFTLYRETTDTGAEYIGNMDFHNPRIINDDPLGNTTLFHLRDYATADRKVKSVNVFGRIDAPDRPLHDVFIEDDSPELSGMIDK